MRHAFLTSAPAVGGAREVDPLVHGALSDVGAGHSWLPSVGVETSPSLISCAPRCDVRHAYSQRVAEKLSRPVSEAVARGHAAPSADRSAAARGPLLDVFGGEIRRRDVVPALVLHLIADEPVYGNRLIEDIEEMTQGVISVNPNTMYPLLREHRGTWADRGSAGSILTGAPAATTRSRGRGVREYKRLREELEPFLDSVIRSVTLIKREIYGVSEGRGGGRHSRVARRGLGPLLRAAAWPAWVDGFGSVVDDRRLSRTRAATLRWHSTPAGSGRGHGARSSSTSRAAGTGSSSPIPQIKGEMTDDLPRSTGEGTRIVTSMDYRPARRRRLRPLTGPPLRALAECSSAGRSPPACASSWRCRPFANPAPIAIPRPFSATSDTERSLRMFVFKAAVVGAGTMGGEIAQAIAAAEIPVVLKDIDQKFVDAGLEKAREVTQGPARPPRQEGEADPGAGRRAARGGHGPDHGHAPTTPTSATSTS